MRILDLLKRSPDVFKKQRRELLLDENAPHHWPKLLVEHHELDTEHKEFLDKIEELKSDIRKSTRTFTDEDELSAIPDRARTINAIHGKEYQTQVEKLLKAATFTELFSFEQEQERYFEANSTFKGNSAKHISVLKEFMHDELKTTQALLQQLEDTVIDFLKVLEERKFPTIRKLHETHRKLSSMTERHEKYRQLLASLEQDLKRTQEKRAKIEAAIDEQHALVRNEASLTALTKVQKLEEELFHMAAQYAQLAKDLLSLYAKHELQTKHKRILLELQKDASAFLGTSEEVQQAFADIVSQLEEENLGNRNLFERLSRLGGSAEADGRRFATAQPDLRALKKDVMKDIAALQMYDKTQFLLRAQAEENTIRMKIEYLQAELSPEKRLTMEREMRDAATSLGAIVKSKQPAAPVAELRDEDEQEDAEKQ